jgi:hypothetical protein
MKKIDLFRKFIQSYLLNSSEYRNSKLMQSYFILIALIKNSTTFLNKVHCIHIHLLKNQD